MPISPASVTNVFGTQSGTAALSLLDTDFANLVLYLNTVLNYSNYVVDSGAANAYVVTLNGTLVFTLTAGVQLQVKIGHNNTGACTIAVNGGAAKSIKTQAGSDPSSGALVANGIYLMMYDGTNWQLI